MLNTIYFLLFIVALLVLALFYSKAQSKNACREIIKIMIDNNALDEESAKTQDELGLAPPTFVQRLSRRRDYKPMTLQMLMQMGIIQMADDGRIFLSEESMNSTKIKDYIK